MLPVSQTFSILPGVRVNLSKTGVSGGLGGHGATVNVGQNGEQVTLGIPGTGLSYRTPLTSGPVIGLILAVIAIGALYLISPTTVHTLLHWWQPRWF